MGISKSGFGAAFGGLAVPMMSLAIPVPQAVAIMLPLLLVMDLVGLAAYRRQADRRLMRILLPAGLAGIVIGFLVFRSVDGRWLSALIGSIAIGFVLQRLWQARRSRTGSPAAAAVPGPHRLKGSFWAALSGFTSFVSHAGGPPLSVYLLPQRLTPQVYVATVTVFFAAINFAKWLPYAALGLIDLRNMATSLALVVFAPIGNWIGLLIAGRIQPVLFYRVVNGALLLTGLKLLWDAFR